MENSYRKSEEQFRAVFDHAAVGIARVAPDGRWLEVNKKVTEITGYSKEELLDKTFQEITHPDDLYDDLEFVEQMLKGEIQTYSMNKRYIHKNTSPIPIHLTVSLIRDHSNQPLFFISVIQPVDFA